MSAGAHPTEENQDNFAFYRKKIFFPDTGMVANYRQIVP